MVHSFGGTIQDSPGSTSPAYTVHTLTKPCHVTETTPKKEYGALCTLRGVEGNAMDPKPQENVQKCQEFYHFRGRAALFQHAIKLQDFD